MRVGHSCTQNRRHDARRGLERVRSEPYPRTGPSSALAILRPTWSCQVRPPPSVSNLQSCLAPVFDLYGEQSDSGKYKCGISFSNRKFGTFHHLSPCGKSFGNFVHRVQRRHWISWWIGFAPIGVSPWFSATTRRLFGRVFRRKPLHRIGNSPLASAPAARRSTARDTTAPHRTTEPRSAPHAEPPGRDPTAPVPSRRSSGKKDVCVEATNGPPRGRLRDGPARVHRGSRAIHRAPTRPRLRRGHRADWKGAFHPVTSTHRAPRPASSSEPIQVNLVHSASFRKPSLTPDMSCSPFRDCRSDSMRSPPSTTRRVRPTSSVQSA